MFDIGFWELLIIFLIVLLVLGPEQLPQFSRDIGHIIAKMRRFINASRQTLERELQLDEAKQINQEIQEIHKLMEQSPDREKPSREIDTKNER